MFDRPGRIVLAVSALALMVSCAPTTQIFDVVPADGFLPKPALLGPGKEGEATLVYVNPNADWPAYTRLILDPVTVWIGADSPLNNVPPEKRQALANAFYADLYAAAATRCEMVTTPSPGTLTIRFALIDAQASDPVLNTISTYALPARILNTIAGYAFDDDTGAFAGSATVEAYATDTVTGKLLWQGVDKRAGANAVGTNTLNSWSDVDNAFKAWAEQFGARMTQLGICL